MNMKKILAIAILVLAVFSCLSVASAGMFDFLGGGVGSAGNKTVSFDVFTLQLPDDTTVSNYTSLNSNGLHEVTYLYNSSTGISGRVTVCNGPNLISSAEGYANNLVQRGAIIEPSHGQWTVINTKAVSSLPNNYVLTYHDGSNLLTIEGDDLAQLEAISDTYQKV